MSSPKNSSKSTPGSITVRITADQTGASYNVGYQDFKITAYKGTSRYDSIYARSKTSIDGGYSGKVPNISQSSITTEVNALKDLLLQDIITQAKKSESNTFVFIPDAFVISFGQPKQDVSNDGTKVTISLSADATALLLSKKDLSKSILKNENMIKTASTTASTTVDLQEKVTYTGDLSAIKISFPQDTNSDDLKNNKNVYFTVTGTSTIYASIDQETAAAAVSTLPVTQAIPVLQELTDSPDVSISIWPFWSTTLPSKDKIKLKIK